MTNETVEKLGAALLQDIEPGQVDGLVRPGRSHRPPKQEPAPPAQKRGRPKKAPLEQGSIYDYVLEDAELEEALSKAHESEEAYKQHRAARTSIQEILKRAHPNVIVGFVDDEEDPASITKGPYAVVGPFRFLATSPLKPATAKKEIPAKPAKRGWRFDSARMQSTKAQEE